MPLFLVYFENPRASLGDLRRNLDARPLRDGLWLVVWGGARSRLYHDIKNHLDAGAPLLVVELQNPPKMMGMFPGSTRWLRNHS